MPHGHRLGLVDWFVRMRCAPDAGSRNRGATAFLPFVRSVRATTRREYLI
jgi:hypothetical protein